MARATAYTHVAERVAVRVRVRLRHRQTMATLNVGGSGPHGGGSADRQRLVAQRAALLATNVYASASHCGVALLPLLCPVAALCAGLTVWSWMRCWTLCVSLCVCLPVCVSVCVCVCVSLCVSTYETSYQPSDPLIRQLDAAIAQCV